MRLNELKAAYLFENIDMTTLKNMIADLLCDKLDACIDFDNIKGGCGSCRTCKTIMNNICPNIYMISSKTIGIDEIRSVNQFLSFKSANGMDNFIIIDCSNGITEQAQNAALKLFEEPPNATHFFIIGIKKEELLPTVLSRLVVIGHKFSNDNVVDERLKTLILEGNYDGLMNYVKKFTRRAVAENLIEIAKSSVVPKPSLMFDKLIDSAINILNYNCNQKIALFGLTEEYSEKNR